MGGATVSTAPESGPEFGSLRSDDDHWDIVSSVGYTALLVAGWRALHALSPQPLVRDEYARFSSRASQDPYLAGVLANPGTTEDETAFPRLYGVQTRFFDDFFGCRGRRRNTAGGDRRRRIGLPGVSPRMAGRDNGFRNRPAESPGIQGACAGGAGRHAQSAQDRGRRRFAHRLVQDSWKRPASTPKAPAPGRWRGCCPT